MTAKVAVPERQLVLAGTQAFWLFAEILEGLILGGGRQEIIFVGRLLSSTVLLTLLPHNSCPHQLLVIDDVLWARPSAKDTHSF